ncbi:MAG: hypothetical protein JWO51_179 [Rhodospirillales bacterium]|nr:hypothetical protein [Rhodospirillales bacterium]
MSAASAALRGLGGEPWTGDQPVTDGYRSFLESEVGFSQYASGAGRGEGGITGTRS